MFLLLVSAISSTRFVLGRKYGIIVALSVEDARLLTVAMAKINPAPVVVTESRINRTNWKFR